MATTKPKENSGLGKEKKNISAPSSVNIPITPTKRTPRSSPRSSFTDHKLPSPSSSSSSLPSLSTVSEKHLPNYLKSTASSRHDQTLKLAKKPAPIPESRPSLNRRRSFDRPPSTAPRLEKPFRSPGPRERATHVPIRSSSFGAKPTTFVSSARPGLVERSVSKISKVGKSQQPVQNLKSSNNAKKSLKKEPNNAASGLPEMAHKTKNAVEPVDQCSLVPGIEEEEIKMIECDLDYVLPDPMPELDNEIRSNQEELNVNISSKKEAGRKDDDVEKKLHNYQPIQDRKISTVVSDKAAEETPPETKTETPEAEAESLIGDEENREPNEGAGEEAKGEEKEERIAEEKEVVVVSEESGKNKNDEEGRKGAVLDQKEAQDGQSFIEENNSNTSNEVTAEETEAAEMAVATTTAAAAAAAGKQRQGGGPGRKESPAVYNDVIEETASKLLETRKNKVKALAGAFQTVIDYESSSK